MRINDKVCLVEDCSRDAKTKGYCMSHYITRLHGESSRIRCARFARTNKGRYSGTKRTAKQRGFGFNLEFNEYEQLIETPCYYCNDYFKPKKLISGTGLDRIDNNLGYLQGNVLSCCGFCNTLRRDKLTVDETKFLITQLIKYRKSQKSKL